MCWQRNERIEKHTRSKDMDISFSLALFKQQHVHNAHKLNKKCM